MSHQLADSPHVSHYVEACQSWIPLDADGGGNRSGGTITEKLKSILDEASLYKVSLPTVEISVPKNLLLVTRESLAQSQQHEGHLFLRGKIKLDLLLLLTS